MTVTTHTPAETELFGECLGRILEPGDIVTLSGELGAGKTRFAGGVAAGLGVDRTVPVTSPTFTILNEYQGRSPLYHFDCYRFRPGEELRDLGFEEQFSGEGICLLEWPERLSGGIADEYLEIVFSLEDEESRTITVTPHGERYEERLSLLRDTAQKWFDRGGDSCYRG